MSVAGCHCARGVTQQQPVVVAREQDDRWGGAGTAADGVDDILPHCGVGGIHRRGRSPVVWGLLAAGKLSARRPAADPCAPRSLLTAQVGTTARQLAARRCRRYLSLSRSLRRRLLAAYVSAAVGPQAPVQLSRPPGPLTAFSGHGGQPRVLRIVDVACLCGF